MDARLSKSMQVYEVLRDAIISLKFAPGALINEKELCAQLEISRTPIREAIQQLLAQNLIDVRPGIGTFVTKIRLQDALEGHVLRRAAEGPLVRLACRNMTEKAREKIEFNLFRQEQTANRGRRLPHDAGQDDEIFSLDQEFHALIAEAAGVPGVSRALRAACSHLDRIRRLAFPFAEAFDTVVREHKGIATLIFERQESAAVKAVDQHLAGAYEALRRMRKVKPDFFSEGTILDLDAFAD